MTFNISSRFRALAVLPISLLLVTASPAQHRGNFFGSYQISQVDESGDQVVLTMKVVLRNNTGKEIKDSSVLLYPSGRPAASIGAFRSIPSLPAEGHMILTQKFTVSKSQYRHWQQGEQPTMALKVPGTDDNAAVDPIDLVPAASLTAPTIE